MGKSGPLSYFDFAQLLFRVWYFAFIKRQLFPCYYICVVLNVSCRNRNMRVLTGVLL